MFIIHVLGKSEGDNTSVYCTSKSEDDSINKYHKLANVRVIALITITYVYYTSKSDGDSINNYHICLLY